MVWRWYEQGRPQHEHKTCRLGLEEADSVHVSGAEEEEEEEDVLGFTCVYHREDGERTSCFAYRFEYM
jgi:hypothetical protein